MVSEIVRDVRSIKEKFRAKGTDARSRAFAKLDLKARDPEAVRAVTFSALWETGAVGRAEIFADELGLAAPCRERGLAGLLDVRPVRLAVGAVISIIHSQVIGDGDGHSRQPALGDSYDLWHALLASAADVFVTRDGRLAKSLERIPIEDFRVVTSLRALLDR